jgi:metal-responsive CopG/Arc/MetJ family transcriptional regulator
MAFVKTGLSIDKQLFKKADEIASKLDISRSKLYQLALEDYIRQYENRQILEKINNAYSDKTTSEENKFQGHMKIYHKKTQEDKW